MGAVLAIQHKAFRRWLEGHAPGETVGERADPSSCPVARYLSMRGYSHVRVVLEGETDVTTGLIDRPWRLSRWARAFIEAFDDSGPIFTQGTTQTALRALDSALDHGRVA